jgi:hypothetical protein
LWITQLQNQPQNESYNKLIYIMSNEKTGRLNREKRSDTLKNSQNLQDGRRKRWRENQKSPRAFSSHNMMREKKSLDRREKERRQREKKTKEQREIH